MISSNFSQLKFFLEGVWGNPFSRKKKVSPANPFLFQPFLVEQIQSEQVEAEFEAVVDGRLRVEEV